MRFLSPPLCPFSVPELQHVMIDQRGELLGSFPLFHSPGESVVCLATDRATERYLFTGDSAGVAKVQRQFLNILL